LTQWYKIIERIIIIIITFKFMNRFNTVSSSNHTRTHPIFSPPYQVSSQKDKQHGKGIAYTTKTPSGSMSFNTLKKYKNNTQIHDT